MPWTKNEQDCSNLASLISYKMYFSESKVPNHIKSYMSQYNHYNFSTHSFDNLCWLTIYNFMLIAFEEKNIVFCKSIHCEDFKVKGAYLYKHVFNYKGIELNNYCVSSISSGSHPIDSLTRTIVGKFGKKGCTSCSYTGENCIYCANGKLRDCLISYPGYKSYDENVWAKIIGEKRINAVEDLAKFMFWWSSNQEFRQNVIDNMDQWDETDSLGGFSDDKSLETFLSSIEENDLYKDFSYDEDESTDEPY